MILDNYENFIQKILDKLSELGIDVSCLNMDHIGYQASSDEDYDNLASEFDAIGERVSENIVGGRRVGIYRLNTPLKHQQYTIEAIELYAPKNGQICLSGLEHAEFILLASFESFLKKYPLVPWDKKRHITAGFSSN